MTITENKIKVDSLEWFYRASAVESDKPPVLLLHGIPSHSYTWCQIMPELAQRGFGAIAPDWIGSGFSAKPDRREFPYTPEAFINALAGFVSALELEQFHLVVQGFLASVAIQYALSHPEQIKRLVILNTPLPGAAKLPWKMQQWGIPFVGDMLTQDPLLVDRTLEGGSGFVISDENLGIYRKPFLKSSAVGRALLATVQNLQLAKTMTEIESGFANWKKPTLIVWGMADPWLAADGAESLAKSGSNIELVKLAEAKHYPQEHWSKEISEEIINFFRRQAIEVD